MSSQERAHKHRRADYEQTLGTIRANTGDPQRPLVAASPLWTTLVANGGLEHEFATSALRAAVENGDVLRWTDGEGTVRYALTTQGLDSVTGSSPYDAGDEAALRDVITTEASRENPDKSVIGWANERLAEI